MSVRGARSRFSSVLLWVHGVGAVEPTGGCNRPAQVRLGLRGQHTIDAGDPRRDARSGSAIRRERERLLLDAGRPGHDRWLSAAFDCRFDHRRRGTSPRRTSIPQLIPPWPPRATAGRSHQDPRTSNTPKFPWRYRRSASRPSASPSDADRSANSQRTPYSARRVASAVADGAEKARSFWARSA